MASNISSFVALSPSVALQIVEVGGGTLLSAGPDVKAAVESIGGGGSDVSFTKHVDASDFSLGGRTTLVTFVLMRDGTEESVAACREFLEMSLPTPHALLFLLSEERPTQVEIEGLSIGLVRSNDLRDMLIVIRMLQAPHDLTGANVSDAFEIFSGQIIEALTLRRDELIGVLEASLPIQGLWLSYSSKMSLAEFDDAAEQVRRVLPDDVNLVWQNGGEQPLDEVDLCIAREVECE